MKLTLFYLSKKLELQSSYDVTAVCFSRHGKPVGLLIVLVVTTCVIQADNHAQFSPTLLLPMADEV